MAQFINPFPGVVPNKKLTRPELIRAIRQNIGAEHEATHLYHAIADATDNPVAIKVLNEVANDERTHIGNFTRLVEMLTGDEGKFYLKGANEVDEYTKDIAHPPYISDQFNPLDPLGIMNMVGKDIQRIVKAKQT